MELFVVLVSIKDNKDARKICKAVEGRFLKGDKDFKDCIESFGYSLEGVKLLHPSDFMTRFNGGEVNTDVEWFSYVLIG